MPISQIPTLPYLCSFFNLNMCFKFSSRVSSTMKNTKNLQGYKGLKEKPQNLYSVSRTGSTLAVTYQRYHHQNLYFTATF